LNRSAKMTASGCPDTVEVQIKRIACRILGGVVEWDKTTELVIQHKLPFLPLLAGSFSIPWPAECGPRGCKNLLGRPDCPRNADSMKAREPELSLKSLDIVLSDVELREDMCRRSIRKSILMRYRLSAAVLPRWQLTVNFFRFSCHDLAAPGSGGGNLRLRQAFARHLRAKVGGG
jgi:hypothetical protein